MGLLKRLVRLFLAANKLSGIIPASIFNSSAITSISVTSNYFHGNLPINMGLTLPNLKLLAAAENNFSGNFPTSITNASGLEILDLSHNKVAGQVPANLGDLTNLQRLNLEINLFGGNSTGDLDFIASLTNCSNLRMLSLSVNTFGGENSFSGSLPPEVGKLIHLVDFNVSHNQLAGGMPISLADCSDLQNLFMQSNFFQGTIPPNLASWKSIEQLDLSSNNLTGPIPKELQKLQFLSYLNLSYNDIEGEIPNTGVFRNESQISLTGNNKLCGGIPELEFPPCPVIKGKTRGKLKVIILLSIVLPAALLVLGFSPDNLIGSGNFGAVYKGRLGKYGNKLVAVKVLDLQKNGASKSFKAECKALRNIRHRNLVSIVSYCSSIDSKGDEFKAPIYELMENGNLDLWLHPSETTDQATSSRSLNLLQKLNIAIDVASALQYLHDHCEAEIVHCDLKPSNILLDNDLVAHVGRRPTDDIFVGDLDLHNYVNGALYEQVSETMNPLLFLEGDENRKITPGGKNSSGGKEMECIISLLKIGLKCSARLPNDRMHMNEVVRKLHLIKDVLLGLRLLTGLNHQDEVASSMN
nr:receptor kinase-like protein Xa21 [Coffea arabica]